MRLGRVFGLRGRNLVDRTIQQVNDMDRNLRLPAAQLAFIFVLYMLLPMLDATTCNSNQVLTTSLKQCTEENTDFSQACRISISTEVTLPHLHSTTCLEFEDDKQQIASLSLTLNKVTCQFQTSRMYFTFPTELRSQSFLSCPQAFYCGWTTHCYAGKQDVPALQPYRDLPGKFGCFKTKPGTKHCLLIHTHACLHYVWFLQPRYSKTFEVRSIDSMKCTPEILLKYKEYNNTIQRKIQGHQLEFENMTISVQGQFDGPTTMFSDRLIVKALPSETNWPVKQIRSAYLFSASSVSAPEVGKVGDVQAINIDSVDFLFAPNIASCSSMVTSVECTKVHSPIHYIDSLNATLPRHKGNHFLYLNEDNVLSSTLLIAPATRLTLKSSDFFVQIRLSKICPEIQPDSFSLEGCFLCSTPARLTFVARSMCSPGIIKVSLEGVFPLAQQVQLTSDFETYIIPFTSDQECPNIEVCLETTPSSVCSSYTACLEPADLPTQLPDLSTITPTLLQEDSSNIWDSLGSWFNDLWYGTQNVLYYLFFFVVFIVIFACFLTCLSRR